jgi:tyrosine aminotransferase
MSQNWKKINISNYARLSINPLRKITQEQKIEANPLKKSITLQLGDPTIFGYVATLTFFSDDIKFHFRFRNFPPPSQLISALDNAVHKDKFPYNISFGKLEARAAVAEYSKHQGLVTADDVILTSGCSHALEM